MTGIEINSEWHRIKDAHKRLSKLASDLEEGWDWLSECDEDDPMREHAEHLLGIVSVLRTLYTPLMETIKSIESEWKVDE